MTIHRFRPVKDVIAKVIRDFGFAGTGWTYNAYEWIGEALDEIGTTRNMIMASKTVLADANNRIYIDCDAEALIGLEDGTCWIPWKNVKDLTNESQSIYLYNSDTDEYKVYGSNQYATVNHNYIELVNIPTQELTLHYWIYARDCNNETLIVDEPVLMDALSWYVASKILLNGIAHPVISWADAHMKYEKLRDKATNQLFIPTVTEFPDTMKHWRNPIM